MPADHDVTDLGLAILQLCEMRGWSQRDLARESGVSRSRISKILKGEEPVPRSLRRIAEAFQVEVPFLRWMSSVCGVGRRAYKRAIHQDTEQSPGYDLAVLADSEISTATKEALTPYHLQLSRDDMRLPRAEDRLWSEALWSRMEKLSAEDQSLVAEVLKRDERAWSLAERLCEASVCAAPHHAGEALRLAQLAVQVARQCPGGEHWRLRVQGYCEAFLANAFRVRGELAKATSLFDRADEMCLQGSVGDSVGLLDASRLLGLKASLLISKGQPHEALALLDQALSSARTEQVRARFLLKRARALEVAGLYETAVKVLNQARPLIERQDQPRLRRVLELNLTVNYCHLDRFSDAEALLPLVEELTESPRHELDSIRLLWLKSRVWAGLGRSAEAITLLADVRQHFHSQEIAYDFALASLELATLCLEEGQTRRVREIAEEIMAFFRSQKLHKEALAALTLFCHAARREKAEAEWTRGLVKYLYRAQHNPGLRFEP